MLINFRFYLLIVSTWLFSTCGVSVSVDVDGMSGTTRAAAQLGLKMRNGTRPHITGPIPQRQASDNGPVDYALEVVKRMRAARSPSGLVQILLY
jgi:hypothetical protein